MFPEKRNLYLHRRTEHNPKYPCEQCEFATSEVSALKKHRLRKNIHIRIIIWLCILVLKSHIIIHIKTLQYGIWLSVNTLHHPPSLEAKIAWMYFSKCAWEDQAYVWRMQFPSFQCYRSQANNYYYSHQYGRIK